MIDWSLRIYVVSQYCVATIFYVLQYMDIVSCDVDLYEIRECMIWFGCLFG